MGVLKFQNVGAGAWRADTGERRTWKIDVDQHGHFFVGVSGQFEGQIGYWPFDRLNDAIVFCENSEMDEHQREDAIDDPPATEAAAPSDDQVSDDYELALASSLDGQDAERVWEAMVAVAPAVASSRPEWTDKANVGRIAAAIAEGMLVEWKKRTGAAG